MLARRLVQNQSISEDAEAQMISLLKNTCGVEYTSKLQRMFQDISSSRDLNQRFSNWITEKQDASRVLYGGMSLCCAHICPSCTKSLFLLIIRLLACAQLIEVKIVCLYVLLSVDFSIMVLSSNAWPFQGPGPMNLPLEVRCPSLTPSLAFFSSY